MQHSVCTVLKVCFFVSADDRTLFIKGIADSVTEDTFREFFSDAMEVRMPHKDGHHKG
jgi:RNA recognition motif-containing protein